jgi:flagellar hook-length control protein FliK
MARRLHRFHGQSCVERCIVPHVASKANVLHPQHAGLSKPDRMPEPGADGSPFSILLAETGNPPAPARNQPARPPGAIAEQRNHGQRGDAMRAEHSQRPTRPDDDCCDEGPAEVTQTAATEQPDKEKEDAADQSEATTTAQALDITQPSAPPAQATGSPAVQEPAAISDAVPAVPAVVEAPVVPAQSAATDTPSLAEAPSPTAAAAPAEAAAPQTSTPAPAPASAPANATAATTPDVANGATTAPEPAQAPQTVIAPQTAPLEPQASPTPAQTTHHSQAPTPAHAKPATAPTETADAANLPESSTIPDGPISSAPVSDVAHAENESGPQRPAPGASHATTQANAPETAERPETRSAVSEFVQTAHPTPDSTHLPHLQTGRDFGQAVAATAHASQHGDASNPLVSAPVPLESVAMEIAARAQGGRNRFEIRLDPPELGRIDVRLDIDRSGQVTSRLVVDKVETLDALRRDAHQLERALQDAGLKTSDNGLQFSLRDQSFAGRNDQRNSDSQHMRVVDPELPAAESASPVYGRMLRGGSGIDIRV